MSASSERILRSVYVVTVTTAPIIARTFCSLRHKIDSAIVHVSQFPPKGCTRKHQDHFVPTHLLCKDPRPAKYCQIKFVGSPMAPSWRAERCVTDLTIERMRLATVGNNRDPATVYNGPLPCETGRPPYCWWPPTSVEGKKRLKSAFCNEKKFSGHLELDLDQEQ